MAKKKRYTQYSPEVNEFGNSAYQALVDKLVDVPSYQLTQLDEAVYYLSRAKECRSVLEHEGLTTTNSRGGLVAHPLVNIEKDCLNSYYKLLGGLMLTLSTQDKARRPDNTAENKALEALLG